MHPLFLPADLSSSMQQLVGSPRKEGGKYVQGQGMPQVWKLHSQALGTSQAQSNSSPSLQKGIPAGLAHASIPSHFTQSCS